MLLNFAYIFKYKSNLRATSGIPIFKFRSCAMGFSYTNVDGEVERFDENSNADALSELPLPVIEVSQPSARENHVGNSGTVQEVGALLRFLGDCLQLAAEISRQPQNSGSSLAQSNDKG